MDAVAVMLCMKLQKRIIKIKNDIKTNDKTTKTNKNGFLSLFVQMSPLEQMYIVWFGILQYVACVGTTS